MKLILSVLAVSLLGCVSTQQQGSSSFPRLEKRFHFHTASQESWYKALHHCSSRGMRLASVLSQEESDRILKQARDLNIQHGDYWIAGTNLGSKPNFYWMGQEKKMDFTNWDPSQPSNTNDAENCIELRKQFDFRWNDGRCEVRKHFVCEEQTLQSNFPATQSLHDIFDLPRD